MKHSWIQLGIGFLPILLGFVFTLLPVPFFLINLLFFLLWIWLCFRFCDPSKPVFFQLLRVCLPGAAILAPTLWLELLTGGSLPGILTSASQFYFFSGISLAGRILTPFLRTITAWPYYTISYLCMSLLCLLAMTLKRKVT